MERDTFGVKGPCKVWSTCAISICGAPVQVRSGVRGQGSPDGAFEPAVSLLVVPPLA